MNAVVRIPIVADDRAGTGRGADARERWRGPDRWEAEESAAKFAAAERAHTIDAITRGLVRFAGWLLIVGGFAALVDETAPDARVKQTADEVLAVIRQSKDPAIRLDLAEQKLRPSFDFRQMAQLALGRSWPRADAAQQDAFERAFRKRFVRAYTSALSRRGDRAWVEVESTAPGTGDPDRVVRTLLKAPGADPVTVDYRLANGAGGWRIVDVEVDHVSLVTQFRRPFQSELGRAGMDGLIRSIEFTNRRES